VRTVSLANEVHLATANRVPNGIDTRGAGASEAGPARPASGNPVS